MSAAHLILDLNRLGIRLEADGDRLRYSPRSAVTPDLFKRLKAEKSELLAMLRPATGETGHASNNANAVWQAALDQLEGDPRFPPDLMEVLRSVDAQWSDDVPDHSLTTDFECIYQSDYDWPDEEDFVDPDDLTPCPKCGSLELWESAAGDKFGRTPGVWRCMKCDPPLAARRLAKQAERIRRQASNGNRY